MTDLRKGVLELQEMTITPNTAMPDLMKVYGEWLNKSMSNSRFLDFNRLFQVENHEFMIMFSFNDAGKIETIQLWPTVQYKSEKWDRTGMQEERRQFCDKWLLERLGEPDRNLGGAEYVFKDLRVSCVTHFDLHNGADAGYIVITYLS